MKVLWTLGAQASILWRTVDDEECRVDELKGDKDRRPRAPDAPPIGPDPERLSWRCAASRGSLL
jgi:hypothetical protein